MDISKAIHSLVPEAEFIVESNSFNKIRWLSKNIPQPTEEEIQTKLAELRNAEPMRLLRQERNRRIALTDWRFRSDLSPSQEWKDYCVALRDLPANYSPTFDILTEDEYPLVKEDNTTPWPEEPTDG